VKPTRRLVARSRQKRGTRLPGLIPWPALRGRRTWAWLDPARLIFLPSLVRLRRRQRPFFTELHLLLDQDGAITLGDVMDTAREQTFGLLILLLALPSLIPGLNVGAAPVGGLAILWIGIQMALGRSTPAVPSRFRQQPIHKGRVKDALARLEGYLERLSRGPRLRRTLNQRWMGALVAWTGFLLAIPVPLPFGNLLPAAILVLLGAALVEERPAWGWLGAAGALGSTIYFAASFDLILLACTKALAVMRHWVS
jgi:hypothetical protein